MKPLVAIVGRPNVGKSMLFNKLCGQRLSIVEDTPGVTRDRLYAQCEWRNRVFDIVDTQKVSSVGCVGFTAVIFLFSRSKWFLPSFGLFLSCMQIPAYADNPLWRGHIRTR